MLQGNDQGQMQTRKKALKNTQNSRMLHNLLERKKHMDEKLQNNKGH